MKLFIALLLTLSTLCCAQSSLDWANQIGGNRNDIVTDSKFRQVGTNDIYVTTGWFTGSTYFGNNISLATGINDTAMFVARFNLNGICQWAVMVGNANVSAWSNSVDIASDGSILVGGVLRGSTNSTVDMDPSTTAATILTCKGGEDIVVARYSMTGALNWAFSLGSLNNEKVTDLAFDLSSTSTDPNFYISGTYQTLLRFDPAGTNSYRLVSTGITDAFVARYSVSTGAIGWAYNFGAANMSQGNPFIKVRGNRLILNFDAVGAVDMNPSTSATNTNDGLGCYNKGDLSFVWSGTHAASLFEIASNGDVIKVAPAGTDGNIGSIMKLTAASGAATTTSFVTNNTTNKPVYAITALALNDNDQVAITGWYQAALNNTTPADIRLSPTKILPSTTYSTANAKRLFTAIYDAQNVYIQGGVIATEAATELEINCMQFKGNTELFLAGRCNVNATFTWDNATANALYRPNSGFIDYIMLNYDIVACVTPTIASSGAFNCGPGQVTVSASTNVGTISWYTVSSGGAPFATGTTITPTLSSTATYYVQSTSGTCVSSRIPVLVSIHTAPVITSSTPNSKCGSGSMILSAATNVGTINWYAASSGGSPLGTGTSFTTPNLSSTTTYYAESVNFTCYSPRVAVQATINPILTPTISISTPSTVICSSSLVTFNSTITNGGSSPQYAWKRNGNVVGSNTSAVTFYAYDNDVITCILTSSVACPTSATVTSSAYTIQATTTVTPTVTIAANSTNFCSGQNIIFTATPTGGGTTPAYQWKRNGTNIGSNLSTFSSSALSNGDVISCVMTSNAVCVYSNVANSNQITVNFSSSVVPSVSIASGGAICTGKPAVFTATPTNGGTPTFQWKRNGANVGTNSSTYTSTSLTTSDVISCVMTSSLGCANPVSATSNSINVTVNPSPSDAITVNGTTITSSQTGATYQWLACPAFSILSGSTSQSYTATQSGTYAVSVTLNGCKDTSVCQQMIVTDLDDKQLNVGLFTLFPTPSAGSFWIESQLPQSLVEVSVYNGRGELMLKKTFNSLVKEQMDLSAFPNGQYLVRCTQEDSYETFKWIKQ
jgi:hypothetical protein